MKEVSCACLLSHSVDILTKPSSLSLWIAAPIFSASKSCSSSGQLSASESCSAIEVIEELELTVDAAVVVFADGVGSPE